MSVPLKSKVARFCTFSTSSSPKETSLPTERSEASATTSSDRKRPLGQCLHHLATDVGFAPRSKE
jgi:hypothetical protein